MKFVPFIILISLSFIGCASVPMGDLKVDAALKEFKAPQDMVGLYIFRNETFGGETRLDVLLDGVEIGSTGASTYLYRVITPGKHTVTSKGEDRDTIEIDVKPSTLVFVWQEVKMGWMAARSRIHLVSEQAGKKGVQESKLAVQ